jgi:ribosomal protein S18 acetylase RimI-like enzyme
LLSTTQKAVEIDENNVRGGPTGVRVRQMDDADLERILELRSVVSWSADPRAFDLLRCVRDARWAVAEDVDGPLVGMVGAVSLGPVGIVCHLAVHDGYRGLGLGTALSTWAVSYLRSRGAETVRLYATGRAEGLYRSLGFRASGARTVYRLGEAPRGLAATVEPGGHRVRTLAFADLPELYGVDRWAYGADRSPLVFATLRLHPGRGLVARDDSGLISGYLIRSDGLDAVRLGPFAAANPGVARLLLSRALQESVSSPVRVIVPGSEKSSAHALLREFGFEGRKDRLRMELGGDRPERPSGLEHYGTTPYLAT